MKNRIAFALLMGVVTTGVITFALISWNLGFGGVFAKVWMRSWGLAYLIVVPIILAVGPALRDLVAKAFATMTKHVHSDAGGLLKKIAFALAMGILTTGVISFAVILMNFGFGGDFIRQWIQSWGLGYLVVIPVLLIVGPAVQRVVDKVFAPST